MVFRYIHFNRLKDNAVQRTYFILLCRLLVMEMSNMGVLVLIFTCGFGSDRCGGNYTNKKKIHKVCEIKHSHTQTHWCKTDQRAYEANENEESKQTNRLKIPGLFYVKLCFHETVVEFVWARGLFTSCWLRQCCCCCWLVFSCILVCFALLVR